MKKKFNVYKIGNFTTFATTGLRGKIKIFQLIERGTPQQIIEDLQKAGLGIIQIRKISNNLRQGRRNLALKLFVLS